MHKAKIILICNEEFDFQSREYNKSLITHQQNVRVVKQAIKAKLELSYGTNKLIYYTLPISIVKNIQTYNEYL